MKRVDNLLNKYVHNEKARRELRGEIAIAIEMFARDELDVFLRKRMSEGNVDNSMLSDSQNAFLNFDFKPGLFLLAGESNSGKTTIAKKLSDKPKNGFYHLGYNNPTERGVVQPDQTKQLAGTWPLLLEEDYDPKDWEFVNDPKNNPFSLAIKGEWSAKLESVMIKTWLKKCIKENYKILIIDELERALFFRLGATEDHYNSAVMFMKEIRDMSIENGITIVLPTHSPHLAEMCDAGMYLYAPHTHEDRPLAPLREQLRNIVNKLNSK